MIWIPTILLALVVFSLWLLYPKKKGKAELLPFLEEWKKVLQTKVKFYQQLDKAQKVRFEDEVFSFIRNYRITGVDLTLTEEDKVLVASSAIIPVFGFPEWEYTNLNEVLVYPTSFNETYETQGKDRNVLGMVGWGVMNRTMILSRSALHQGFENEHSKANVGIHEFMHLIDKSDGAVDGMPEAIMSKQYMMPWLKMMHKEIQEIRAHHSDINPYGATNEAEFFSVVGEYFFSQPRLFQHKHPELYQILEDVFNPKAS